MVAWELSKYIPEKVLKRISRFLIIWGALSWQLIFSVQHRQMRNFGVIMSSVRKKPVMFIIVLAGK